MKQRRRNIKKAENIRAMAAAGVSKETASDAVDIPIEDLQDGGLYHNDWKIACATADCAIQAAFYRFAASGDCLEATEHWLKMNGVLPSNQSTHIA